MRILFIGMLAVLMGCRQRERGDRLFHEWMDKENVVIVLSNYGLDTVPPEIGLLKKAQSLIIVPDSSRLPLPYYYWTTQSPSEIKEYTETPPFLHLPEEICELKNLKMLAIYGVGLKTLPDDFGNLENLSYLTLQWHKLNISNEVGKLKKLKNLRDLNVTLPGIDSAVIRELKAANKNLEIATTQ